MIGKLNALFAPIIKAAQLAAHPVGSIYIRADDADPSVLFGGTWERFAQGRVLICADDNYPIGSIGGEETHALTVAELAQHNHKYTRHPLFASEKPSTTTTIFAQENASGLCFDTSTLYTGGNRPHNNMQPYIAVGIWRRTA